MNADEEELDNDYPQGGCICAGAVLSLLWLIIMAVVGVFWLIEKIFFGD